MKDTLPFWRSKTLQELTPDEWEQVCDGCAKCCIIKFEDEDTGRIYHTNVVCEFLEIYHCRCTSYQERSVLVPTCLTLTPELAASLNWMPDSCAYRLLSEGKDLPLWHPLVSGDPKSVHKAGISVRGRVISGRNIDPDDLTDYVVDDDEGA
ncbi:MAG: YcgN family cysteine cluster protein [Chloroflexi bacterium]|nr:YcgN family cysteine cluster protein [Chloroflexota bacterium]